MHLSIIRVRAEGAIGIAAVGLLLEDRSAFRFLHFRSKLVATPRTGKQASWPFENSVWDARSDRTAGFGLGAGLSAIRLLNACARSQP
jgi:hypothetical protein